MAVPRLAPLLACAILVLAHGAVFADSLEEIFERGNRAYDDERFDEAAESYRTLLEYQIEDPRVEYNLGNTEFRRGNLGQAILHYERAKRLDPTDPDILDNLRFARSHRLDRVPEPVRPEAIEWLVGLQDRLGPDRQAWLAVAVLWLVCASVAFALSRAGRWNAGYGWLLAVLVLVIVLLGASWYATRASRGTLHGGRGATCGGGACRPRAKQRHAGHRARGTRGRDLGPEIGMDPGAHAQRSQRMGAQRGRRGRLNAGSTRGWRANEHVRNR
jgi:hypothetical protein